MSLVGALGALWGVAGIMVLLGEAVYRLVPIAIGAFESSFSALQWSFLVVWVVAMAVMEGYLGFQRSFSPRVAARAKYLTEHPNPVRSLLAPVLLHGGTSMPPAACRSVRSF